MLGWFRLAAMRASSKNISMNSSSSARWGRIRFTTSSFSKPEGPFWRARNTAPIPPVAILRSSWYRPKVSKAAGTIPQGSGLGIDPALRAVADVHRLAGGRHLAGLEDHRVAGGVEVPLAVHLRHPVHPDVDLRRIDRHLGQPEVPLRALRG